MYIYLVVYCDQNIFVSKIIINHHIFVIKPSYSAIKYSYITHIDWSVVRTDILFTTHRGQLQYCIGLDQIILLVDLREKKKISCEGKGGGIKNKL